MTQWAISPVTPQQKGRGITSPVVFSACGACVFLPAVLLGFSRCLQTHVGMGVEGGKGCSSPCDSPEMR